MKFTNGTWDLKEGIKVFPATEVSKLSTLPALGDADTQNDNRSQALRALCTTRHIRQRGDTLNKPTITIELSSPGESGLTDVIELRAHHFKGKPALKESRFGRFPDFKGKVPSNIRPVNVMLRVSPGVKVDTSASTSASITCGTLSATLDTRPDSFNIDFSYLADSHKKVLTSVGFNSLM
ncbi:hypothetical protein M422DRAFT_46808 [Sphaerobolus stellatus SS14]|uniref:Uncharacterized protein n=1 Tax=Sphaerobolus stellatus (strain SS14) TaxID=990650 RepID=A0A0C9UR22_SPHS4|nr:hypothetical protein M422DRAFT_46808 [Sphaerobolus stellatus SS14]